MRLTGSVGQGGKNFSGDVLYVQILVSDWLLLSGKAAIALDGIAGSKTISAIRNFQTANRLAVVDGLVETNRSTIKALEAQHIAAIKRLAVVPPSAGAIKKVGATGAAFATNSFFDIYLDRLRG